MSLVGQLPFSSVAPSICQISEKGLNCTPNSWAYKLEKTVVLQKANYLGKGLFYYQLSSSIYLFICIVHSSRKAYIKLCMRTLAVKYVSSWKTYKQMYIRVFLATNIYNIQYMYLAVRKTLIYICSFLILVR